MGKKIGTWEKLGKVPKRLPNFSHEIWEMGKTWEKYGKNWVTFQGNISIPLKNIISGIDIEM